MQAQTNPMNPQGLASLMKGMPQGQPNPAQPNPLQPQPASPGSISQIRDTYGTNTVPRDLKALLALNEALQMVKSAENQQQLQTPVPQGTIKDQMTQAAQGIMQQAQGVAGASQQQEAQKQAMLQRMMGVAGAPGAAQVMPPRMAMGGVVAFQNQGAVPMPVADQPQIRRTYGSAPDYEDARRFGINLSPYDSPEVRAEKLERLRRMREFEAEQQAKGRAEIPTEESQAAQEAIARAYADQSRQRDVPPRPAPPRPAAAPRTAPPAGIAAAPRQTPVLPAELKGGITMPGAAAPQRDVAPQLGAMEQGSALPALMRQTAGAPEGATVQGMLRSSGIDPDAIARQREEAAKAVYGMSDEEKRIYEERLKRMRGEMAPKDTRWYERLGELASRYAARPVQGSNVGALGGIATVGAELGRERLTEQQKRQAEIDALQEKFLGAQRQARTGAFEVGEAARRAAMGEMIKAGGIGAELTGQRVRAETEAAGLAARAREGELDRQARERLARLDADTRMNIARMEAASRAGDQQAQREIQRINAAMNDPRLKKLGELAAGSPAYQTRYDDALKETLERVAPGLFSKKPAPTGGAASTAKPDDPLGIRK